MFNNVSRVFLMLVLLMSGITCLPASAETATHDIVIGTTNSNAGYSSGDSPRGRNFFIKLPSPYQPYSVQFEATDNVADMSKFNTVDITEDDPSAGTVRLRLAPRTPAQPALVRITITYKKK